MKTKDCLSQQKPVLKSGSLGAGPAQQSLSHPAARLLWSAGSCSYGGQRWYASLSRTLQKLSTKYASCIIRLKKCLIWKLLVFLLLMSLYIVEICYWDPSLLPISPVTFSLEWGTQMIPDLFWVKVLSKKAFVVWSEYTMSSAAHVESELVSTCRIVVSVAVYNAWGWKRKIL